MKYVKIAKVSDFETNRFRVFSILAKKVRIFRGDDGELFATELVCKHQNWDLSTGRIDDNLCTCPRHGWQYDLRTGECLNHDSAPLRRYGLKCDGDNLYITLRPLGVEP